MEPQNRLEKMVGEILGLRMLVAQLVAAEAARSADPSVALALIKKASLEAMAEWPIGSDTKEGAERIRAAATHMLTLFPDPSVGR